MVQNEKSKTMKAAASIFREAGKVAPGTINGTPEGYFVTPERLLDIIIGLMSIKRYQSMPIYKAKEQLQANRPLFAAFLLELLQQPEPPKEASPDGMDSGQPAG
jgi:hypothetical protein